MGEINKNIFVGCPSIDALKQEENEKPEYIKKI